MVLFDFFLQALLPFNKWRYMSSQLKIGSQVIRFLIACRLIRARKHMHLQTKDETCFC